MDDQDLGAMTEPEFGGDESSESGTDEEDPGPGETPDDLADITDPQAALGDITCATSSNTDWINQYGCNLLGGSYCYHSTPNTAYHDDYTSGESCQPYVTLKTQTAGMTSSVTLQHQAIWIDTPPANKSQCELSHIELATYHYDQNGGTWNLNGTLDRRGTWMGSYCHFGIPAIVRTMTCNSLGKCQHAQAVAARAYIGNYFWFPTSRKVHVGTFRL